MRLYEVNKQFEEFADAVERGDVPEEAIADTLESINAEFDEAVDCIACLIKDFEAEAEAIREEAKRLDERAAVKMKRAKRMKQYLQDSLLRRGFRHLETSRHSISFRKSKAVEVDDPDSFIQWAQDHARDDLLTYADPTLNKAAIKEAIESGAEIAGASIVERQNMILR